MKGLDTNILVRFLVGDDKLQAKTVYNLFKKVESAKDELFVPTLVVLELIWVLEAVYKVERKEILNAIHDLLSMPILHFENHSTLQKFIKDALSNTYDLSDLLIAYSAGKQGCTTVITFDKKASKSELFELV